MSPPTLAPCIIHHCQSSILLFRNNSTAVEHPHPVDCLTTTLRSQPRGRGWLSSHAGTADSTEAGLARMHAFLKAGRLTATRVRALLQTPLSPRRAMFRKESRGGSLDTQLPKRVIVTDSNEEWGFGCVSWTGSGPLSSHPAAHPMLCVCGDQQQHQTCCCC